MSDSDSKEEKPSLPSWQQRASQPEDKTEPAAASSTEKADAQTEAKTEKTETTTPDDVAKASEGDSLEVARKFLDDESVRDAPREKKVAFLKSKDISESDIQTLLGDEPISSSSETDAAKETAPTESPSQPLDIQTSPTTTTQTQTQTTDRAPIVTYPEFLAKADRSPPLVTKDRLLNTLYGIVGLSTLAYGTGKYVVKPMVDAQIIARTDFHESTVQNLDALVSKLEKTVSVVPPKKNVANVAATDLDNESEADDPTEMFHRDMGTQTSFPLTTTSTIFRDSKDETTVKHQTDRLTGLTKTLSSLKDDFRSQSEVMDGLSTQIDGLRDDLDTLTYEGRSTGAYDIYGRTRKPEPDDEIRKARDNIRRVKGVFLSTRNFPATAR